MQDYNSIIIAHLQTRLSGAVRAKDHLKNVIKEYKTWAASDDRAYALCVTAKKNIKIEEARIKFYNQEIANLYG